MPKFFLIIIKRRKKKIESYFCICSKKLQCEDLIGITIPNFSSQIESDTSGNEGNIEENNKNEILKFKEGFLVRAIKNARCVIFDQINEAPSTVYERLNGLLDKKYNDEDNTFPIPEYSEKANPKIKKNFRIICTCNSNKLKNISPAFLSRFDIVYLENQLDNINEYRELVETLFQRFEKLEKEERKMKKEKKDKEINSNNNGIEYHQPNEVNDNMDYSVSDKMINLVIDKIKILKNVDSAEKKYISNYSISSISRFCFSIYKLLLKFRDKLIREINEEEIVNIVFDLRFLKNPNEIKISKYPSIRNFILEIIKNIKQSELEENYSFENSENLENFVGIVYLSSLINLYLCVESPPGYGKKTAARVIAKMREIDENLEKKFYIQTFHSSTYPTNLYGTSTINYNQITFNKGPLTRALIEEKFFIADELNISPLSTILSIVPILDLIFDTRLFIPGMVSYNKEFRISSSFFLIICQNNVGIIGRSELPASLLRKIRKINYPELEDKEIKKICNDIDIFLSNHNNNNILIGKEESEKIAKCMIQFKKEKQHFKEPWSLRDVTKLIKRLKYQKEKK